MNSPSWKSKRTFIVNPHASTRKKRIENFWGRKIFDQRNLIAIDQDFKSGISPLENALIAAANRSSTS
jgi:hypothetical protein